MVEFYSYLIKTRTRLPAPPVDDKANEKVSEVLTEYFGKRKRQISILKEISSRDKTVEII